jgi:hypothetical protein
MTDNDDIESQPRRPRRNLHGAKDTEARSLLTSSIDETPAAITGGHTTLISSLTNYFTGNNDDDDDDDDDGSAQAVKPKQSVKSKEEELFEQALDASGFFRCLSDETFAEILDLLDIRSFGRMARTCTRASRITSDLSFLRTKAERGSWSHGRRGVVAHSRDEYRELFRAHLKREKDDARARQTQQLAQHKQKQKQRATTLTALMFAFFWELASVVCIWTVLIRTVVKLDGLYDPSWASVLWPLALPGMQFTFGNFITGTMLYAYSSTGFDLSDIDRRHVCGPFLFGLMYIWPAKNEVAPFATLITLPAGVATLLLLAKIAYYAGNPSFPFLVCAAPVGVQTLLLSAGLLSKKLIPEPYEVDFVFFSIIFLLWGIEALFIAAKVCVRVNLCRCCIDRLARIAARWAD